MARKGTTERFDELVNMDHEALAGFATMCDSRLNAWEDKFGFLQAGSLNKPLTRWQRWNLDGFWWNVGLWLKRNLP